MAVAPKHVRVLLPHNTQPDHDVEEIGGSVLGNLYIPPGKNNFPAPPVDQVTLQTGVNDFLEWLDHVFRPAESFPLHKCTSDICKASECLPRASCPELVRSFRLANRLHYPKRLEE